MYAEHLRPVGALVDAPAELLSDAARGLGQGLAAAAQAPEPLRGALHDAVAAGSLAGLHAGCLTAAAVCTANAVAVLLLLPARPAAPGR